jgi:sporulation-control protein spo0M
MMDTHVFGEGVEFFQELAFVLTQFRPSKNEVEVVPEHEHPQEHDFHQPVEGFANKKLCHSD